MSEFYDVWQANEDETHLIQLKSSVKRRANLAGIGRRGRNPNRPILIGAGRELDNLGIIRRIRTLRG